jgi:hypothetical protein
VDTSAPGTALLFLAATSVMASRASTAATAIGPSGVAVIHRPARRTRSITDTIVCAPGPVGVTQVRSVRIPRVRDTVHGVIPRHGGGETARRRDDSTSTTA